MKKELIVFKAVLSLTELSMQLRFFSLVASKLVILKKNIYPASDKIKFPVKEELLLKIHLGTEFKRSSSGY